MICLISSSNISSFKPFSKWWNFFKQKVKNLAPTFFVIPFLCVLLFNNAFAQTIYVSQTAQLRQALESAALNGEADTIILSSGVYKTTDDGLGTFKFSDSQDYNLTIQASDGADVILDGANTHQVLNLTNTKNTTFFIKNISITNGNTQDGYAGIYASKNLELVHCTVNNHKAKSGAVYAYDLKIVDSNISNTQFQSKDITTYATNSVNLYLKNSYISNNENSAIFFSGVGTIEDSFLSDNNKSGLGSTGNTLVLKNTHIVNNGERGISSGVNGNLKISDSNISNNGKSGIYIDFGTKALISHSDISNNTDGIYVFNTGKVAVLNSILQYNSSYGFSANLTTGSVALLINSVLAHNKIGFKGPGLVVNTLFDQNSQDDIVTDSGKTYIFNNYVDYLKILESTSSYSTILKKDNIQSNLSPLNFAENYIPQNGMGIIDAGLNLEAQTFINYLSEFSSDTTFNTQVHAVLKSDKLHNARINGTNIDIGAYEYESVPYTGTAPTITFVGAMDYKLYATATISFNIALAQGRTIRELWIDNGNGTYASFPITTTILNVTSSSIGTKTVKIKVVDSESEISEKLFILNILDLTTQEAIEYGKNQCKENPASCGIGITSDTNSSSNITKAYVDALGNGWHMLGTAKTINAQDDVLFETVTILWYYDNASTQWKAYSKTLGNSLLNYHGIELLDVIPENNGFWIKK